MQRFLLLILTLLLSFTAMAQSDSSKIRMSLLTCGVGDELYSSFGHTGLRVIDSATGRDDVYNYGLFDFYDPDFYPKFVRGKLLYFVGVQQYLRFLNGYEDEERSVVEQELQLNELQKQKILDFLKENLKPENASYNYDFLYDNCATRVRDIFPKTLGEGFKFGQVAQADKPITFRGIINIYLHNNHWSRLGIDIILGSRIDKVMSNEESMFLPDMLMQSLAKSTLDGNPIVTQTLQKVKGKDRSVPTANTPMWTMVGVLVFTILVYFLRPLAVLRKPLAFLYLFLTGALGVLLLFMWLGTNHQSCDNNYNLLWALPFNLPFAFMIFKARRWHIKYCIFAIILLLLALFIHVIGIQVMPLTELMPFLIALLYTYLYVYKRSIATFGSNVKSSIA